MLVSTENLQDCLEKVAAAKAIATDTETTGLNSFKAASLFAIIISTPDENYYFNFKDYPDENVVALPKDFVVGKLKPIFLDDEKVHYLQNAKFDLHMLAKEGIFFGGKIYDLMFLDRLHFNQHMSYRLSEITKRWGDHKDDGVWKYITDNKLMTHIEYPALGKSEDVPHFDQVPLHIMQPYGEQDGSGTLKVGMKIRSTLIAEDTLLIPGALQKQMAVCENETRLVHTLFRMEQRGVQLDIPYCEEALKHYMAILRDTEIRFKEITGLDFVKGTTVFEEAFLSEKYLWEKTEKGRWKWDADIMATFQNPAAQIAIEYSEAKKQSEYFANFLFYCDSAGVLHTDFQQSGTVTGRLSCREPNLQNLTNPDKYEEKTEASLYPVRRSFIPREGFFFAMPDYSQVEFRILLDVAKANGLINEVLKGLDVHTATANISGTSRKEAKTNNFLTAYGGGVVKLATNLYKTKGSRNQLGAIYKQMFGWRLSDAEKEALPTVTQQLREFNTPIIQKAYDLQQSIFRSAPEIKDLLKQVQRAAESRGYVKNWLGRRYYYTDKRFCYKAPNHLIQGGAAEVIKIAMNRVDEFLMGKESKMIISIHDELIIEVKYGEEYVIEEIKKIMESVYPYKRLPLLVDIEYSEKNLSDKLPWDVDNFLGVKKT